VIPPIEVKSIKVHPMMVEDLSKYLTIKENQRRFYDRETTAAVNYEIQQMSFIPLLPSMQLK
jgi:hypothetical protein